MQTSRRGCKLKVSAFSETEDLVVVARQNAGQAGTGMKRICSAYVQKARRHPGCRNRCVVVWSRKDM